MSDYLFLDLKQLPEIVINVLTREAGAALADPLFVQRVNETMKNYTMEGKCIFGLQTLKQELKAIENLLIKKIDNPNNEADFAKLNEHFANMVFMSTLSISWGSFSEYDAIYGWWALVNNIQNAQDLYLKCINPGPVSAETIENLGITNTTTNASLTQMRMWEVTSNKNDSQGGHSNNITKNVNFELKK